MIKQLNYLFKICCYGNDRKQEKSVNLELRKRLDLQSLK